MLGQKTWMKKYFILVSKDMDVNLMDTNNINSSKGTAFLLLFWFGLWCLMPLSTIFQLYRGSIAVQ